VADSTSTTMNSGADGSVFFMKNPFYWRKEPLTQQAGANVGPVSIIASATPIKKYSTNLKLV